MSRGKKSLTFYLITYSKGRSRRYPLQTIDHYPTDWLELKLMLRQIMEQVYIEHHTTEDATVSLERHIGGKSFVAITARYSQERIPYEREYESMFKLDYNPKMNEVTVRQASFNYTLNHLREGFWWEERGIRWKSGPLIPREHQNPDILQMLSEPSGTRYVDYSRQPKPIYGVVNDTADLSYQRNGRGLYTRKPGRRV